MNEKKGYAVRCHKGIFLADNPQSLRRKDVYEDERIVELAENEWRAHASGIDGQPMLFTRIDQSFTKLNDLIQESYGNPHDGSGATRKYVL